MLAGAVAAFTPQPTRSTGGLGGRKGKARRSSGFLRPPTKARFKAHNDHPLALQLEARLALGISISTMARARRSLSALSWPLVNGMAGAGRRISGNPQQFKG